MLGNGAQDGTRRDVPHDDLGSEEEAYVKEMPLLIKPQTVGSPKPLEYEGSRVRARVNFINNTGSRFKVSLGGGVQQASGMVASEAVAYSLRHSFRTRVSSAARALHRCAEWR